jgi:hypothetical protein
MKFFLVLYICSSVTKTCGQPMEYNYKFEDWSSCVKKGGELIVDFSERTNIKMNKDKLYVTYFCGDIKLKEDESQS